MLICEHKNLCLVSQQRDNLCSDTQSLYLKFLQYVAGLNLILMICEFLIMDGKLNITQRHGIHC